MPTAVSFAVDMGVFPGMKRKLVGAYPVAAVHILSNSTHGAAWREPDGREPYGYGTLPSDMAGVTRCAEEYGRKGKCNVDCKQCRFLTLLVRLSLPPPPPTSDYKEQSFIESVNPT